MTKQYIEEFKAAQAEWKRKEEQVMAEENEKIQAFANLQKEREEAQKLEKQARYTLTKSPSPDINLDVLCSTVANVMCCLISEKKLWLEYRRLWEKRSTRQRRREQRWRESEKNCIWRNKRKLPDRKKKMKSVS